MVAPVSLAPLNRLRASVVFADFPELQIISTGLTREGVNLAFQGDASQNLPTMTGLVGSPEPYQVATITVHCVRSQAISAAFKNQIEQNTTLGSVNVITDASNLPDYPIENVVLLGVDPLAFDGNQPAFVIRMSGSYMVNAELWASS